MLQNAWTEYWSTVLVYTTLIILENVNKHRSENARTTFKYVNKHNLYIPY